MKKRDYVAELTEFAPDRAARLLKRRRSKLHAHAPAGPVESVRQVKYRGHKIKISTTYEIRIDGRVVGGHLEVGNDGRVHYHGLPNYSWGSAVDMCQQLIDSFPADFPGRGKKPRQAHMAHKKTAPKQAKKKKKRRRKRTYRSRKK